jgi:hypothetical protein
LWWNCVSQLFFEAFVGQKICSSISCAGCCSVALCALHWWWPGPPCYLASVPSHFCSEVKHRPLKNFPISCYLLEVILTQCKLHAHCTPSFPLQFVDIRNFVHSWTAADYHLNALSAQWALGSASCKLLIYRYKNELSEEDKEKLRHLMWQHKHYLVFSVKFLCDVLKGIVIIPILVLCISEWSAIWYWELMMSGGSHGWWSSLPYVSETHKVMTALFLVLSPMLLWSFLCNLIDMFSSSRCAPYE